MTLTGTHETGTHEALKSQENDQRKYENEEDLILDKARMWTQQKEKLFAGNRFQILELKRHLDKHIIMFLIKYWQ